MANENREIEIKVKVKDNKPLLKFLKENGEYIKEKKQIDEYYNLAHRDFLAPKRVKEWLRLRDEGNKISINYKNWYIEEDDKTFHCDEYETEIGDLEKMKLIFKSLDIRPVIVVDKTRQIYNYQDYEVAIDKVKDLGDYVELEYRGNEEVEDARSVAEEMKQFIVSTGCEILEQDFKGYPYLLLEKKNLV